MRAGLDLEMPKDVALHAGRYSRALDKKEISLPLSDRVVGGVYISQRKSRLCMKLDEAQLTRDHTLPGRS